MAVMNETKTVAGVFNGMEDAQSAVHELESAGFSRESISVVANKRTAENYQEDTAPGATADAGVKHTHVTTVDVGIGATLGGIGGLLLSFAAFGIPGVGPVLAAGPIVATLSGAGIGAVAGGIISALTQSGIPEEDAHYYAEGIRRGHVLVTVHTDDVNAPRVQDILDRFGAIDVEGRAESWRERGWSGHDPGAEPLSADELRREREYRIASQHQAEQWSNRPIDAIGESLPLAEARNSALTDTRENVRRGPSLARAQATNAAIDREGEKLNAPTPFEEASRETGSMAGDTVKPLRRGEDNPSNYSDLIENNVRRPDPAVVRAERGSERALDSAVQSARRMGSRVYDRKRS